MHYQKPTFTLPTVTKRIDQTTYEICVGLRCPGCYKLLEPGKPHKKCESEA